MKNRKNLENLQLNHSQKNSETPISEHLFSFDFAAGFPPFLRGTHATPTPTKSIQRFTLEFTEVEAQQLVLTLNTTAKKRIQIQSVSEFKEIIKDLPSTSILQISYNKHSLLILAICGAISEVIANQKIAIQLIFNSLHFYLEEKKQALNIQKELDIMANSEFCKRSVSFIFSEKRIAKHQLSVSDCLAINLYAAFKYIQQHKKLFLKLELESTSDYFLEIAKARAARALWSKLTTKLKLPPTSAALAIVSTKLNIKSSKNVTEKITQSVLKANASFVNETQAIQLTKNTKITAENIFQYLEKETLINKTTDPWGGSFYVEGLTQKIIEEAWYIISEIEKGITPDSLKDMVEIENRKNLAFNKEDFDYSIIKFEADINSSADSIEVFLQKINQNPATSNSILDSAIEAIVAGASINEVKLAIEKAIIN